MEMREFDIGRGVFEGMLAEVKVDVLVNILKFSLVYKSIMRFGGFNKIYLTNLPILIKLAFLSFDNID